jgi:hypothetical protein
MREKRIQLLIGILAFVAVGYLTRQAVHWFRKGPGIPSRLLERTWIDQPIAKGETVVVAVPWPLDPAKLDFPPEMARMVTHSETLRHQADGLHIMTMYAFFGKVKTLSLDQAADGALRNIKTVPGTASVKSAKRETTVLGCQRAFELEARITRTEGEPVLMHELMFVMGRALYQIILIHMADEPLGPKVWDRIRSNIRYQAPSSP